MKAAEKYTYRIMWSDEDQEFVATVAEFPSISWLDKDRNNAFNGAVELIEGILSDMEESGEEPPVPMSERQYSGKFQLRLPPEIHKRLAIEAAEQGVSLNRLIASRI